MCTTCTDGWRLLLLVACSARMHSFCFRDCIMVLTRIMASKSGHREANGHVNFVEEQAQGNTLFAHGYEVQPKSVFLGRQRGYQPCPPHQGGHISAISTV